MVPYLVSQVLSLSLYNLVSTHRVTVKKTLYEVSLTCSKCSAGLMTSQSRV